MKREAPLAKWLAGLSAMELSGEPHPADENAPSSFLLHCVLLLGSVISGQFLDFFQSGRIKPLNASKENETLRRSIINSRAGTNRMRTLLYLICAASLPIVCEAGGSLGLSELNPLLKQKPALTSFLSQSFELSDSVFAEVRLGPDFTHLSAYHLGPYSIRANPKGSKAISPVLVTICTQYQFLNVNGEVLSHETDEMFQATQVKEELTAILIQDISAEDKRPVCPD